MRKRDPEKRADRECRSGVPCRLLVRIRKRVAGEAGRIKEPTRDPVTAKPQGHSSQLAATELLCAEFANDIYTCAGANSVGAGFKKRFNIVPAANASRGFDAEFGAD